MRIGKRLTLYAGLAGLVEWVIVGMVIGLVYKQAAAGVPSRRAAGV